MNLISLPGQDGVFLINVFAVPPENQRALADAIAADGRDVVLPGLLARYLLRSEDGAQVTHCMHWASEDAFKQAVATNPLIGQIRQRVHELGASPSPQELIKIR